MDRFPAGGFFGGEVVGFLRELVFDLDAAFSFEGAAAAIEAAFLEGGAVEGGGSSELVLGRVG